MIIPETKSLHSVSKTNTDRIEETPRVSSPLSDYDGVLLSSPSNRSESRSHITVSTPPPQLDFNDFPAVPERSSTIYQPVTHRYPWRQLSYIRPPTPPTSYTPSDNGIRPLEIADSLTLFTPKGRLEVRASSPASRLSTPQSLYTVNGEPENSSRPPREPLTVVTPPSTANSPYIPPPPIPRRPRPLTPDSPTSSLFRFPDIAYHPPPFPPFMRQSPLLPLSPVHNGRHADPWSTPLFSPSPRFDRTPNPISNTMHPWNSPACPFIPPVIPCTPGENMYPPLLPPGFVPHLQSGLGPSPWLSPSTKCHERFFFSDATFLIEVKDTAYRIHAHFIQQHAPLLCTYPPLRPPVTRLYGIEPHQFELVLSLFYPKNILEHEPQSLADWSSVLHVAHSYSMGQIRTLAISKLESLTSAAEKIELANKYDVKDWLVSAYLELSLRLEGLSVDEGSKVGHRGATMIANMKQQVVEGIKRFVEFETMYE